MERRKVPSGDTDLVDAKVRFPSQTVPPGTSDYRSPLTLGRPFTSKGFYTGWVSGRGVPVFQLKILDTPNVVRTGEGVGGGSRSGGGEGGEKGPEGRDRSGLTRGSLSNVV